MGVPYFVQNPECNKIRGRVGEAALGGDFITICSAFLQRSEEGQQGIASLESGDGFADRGYFCKACSLNGMPRRESFPELTRILSQFVWSPEIEGSVSGLFCVDFKPGLIDLGAEVDEKSAVKLRDL